MAFLAALANGMSLTHAMLFASSGNILAIILNYFFGYWLYEKSQKRLKSSKTGLLALHYGSKYGYGILFFSWLPAVGDPLTLVAGLLRLNFVSFLLIAGTFRIGRYYFLTLMV